MITLDTIATKGNAKAAGATVIVQRGYKAHSISLTAEAWAAVSAGKPISFQGDEYTYEGETFWDYWSFNSTSAGSLQIEYGDDDGAGFDGELSDASIEEHTDV